MSTIAIFSAPKPFLDTHISRIQHNAIRSWKNLGDAVDVYLIGDEPGIAEACAELGVTHLPGVRQNESGTPLVSSIFELAREASPSQYLLYANADMILFPDILDAVQVVRERFPEFLIVGQRTDVYLPDSENSLDRIEDIRELAVRSGRLHHSGIDYFLFPRTVFREIPDFAIGRAGWDNWMVYKAKKEGWAVVDATRSIFAIHQNHDYRHLPGGEPHYRTAESFHNVKLAGGMRNIYLIKDSDKILAGSRVKSKPVTLSGILRKVELVLTPDKPVGLRWRLVMILRKLQTRD